MSNPNNEINLDLTLRTGPAQNPTPINPFFRAMHGDTHQWTAVEESLLMADRQRRQQRYISFIPILPPSGPYSTDVSRRPQSARPYQPHALTNDRGKSVLMGESSSPLEEWVPRSVAKQTLEEMEQRIAASYYDFNRRLQKMVAEQSATILQLKETVAEQQQIINKQKDTISELQYALLVATYKNQQHDAQLTHPE